MTAGLLPVSYYAPQEQSSPRFAFAFARGCNGTMTDETDLFPGPVALFGSPSRWPVLRQAQAQGRDWYYADHGYFGKGRYYRVTRNAYQHDGRGLGSPERFAALHRPIQPWQSGGGHVLICPNSDVYFGLHGLGGSQWLRNVMHKLRRHTDRKLRVRWKTQRQSRPIAADLSGAWLVVVYSSAAALDALIAGVPVCTLAPFASTVRMGLTDLSAVEHPIRPDDREAFLHVLASQQWTLPEMMAGRAWRDLQQHEDTRAA